MSAEERQRGDAVAGVFDVLGDPTRRQLVGLLTTRGPSTATRLSDELDISRQAVAKHLDLMHEVGLTAVERVGREVRHELIPQRIDDAAAWLTAQAAAWSGRLARIESELERRST